VLNCLSLELPTLKGLIKKGILATAFCAKRQAGHIKIELMIGSLAPDGKSESCFEVRCTFNTLRSIYFCIEKTYSIIVKTC
jgi:hypothetical protein